MATTFAYINRLEEVGNDPFVSVVIAKSAGTVEKEEGGHEFIESKAVPCVA